MRWTAALLLTLTLLWQSWGAPGGPWAGSVQAPAPAPAPACRCCDCGGNAWCAVPCDTPRPPSPAVPVRAGSVEDWVAPRPIADSLPVLIPCDDASPIVPCDTVPSLAVVPLFLRGCALLI